MRFRVLNVLSPALLIACGPRTDPSGPGDSAVVADEVCPRSLVVTATDADKHIDVAATGDGGALFAGTVSGEARIAGERVVAPEGVGFVVRVDAEDRVVWRSLLGGGAAASVVSVAVASDETVWVAGSYDGAADLGLGPVASGKGTFATHLAADGTVLDVLTVRGGSGWAQVAPAPDGGAFLAGGHQQAVLIGTTEIPGTGALCGATFLARLESDASPAWVQGLPHGLRTVTFDGSRVLLVQHEYCYLMGRGSFLVADADGQVELEAELWHDPHHGARLTDGRVAIGGSGHLDLHDASTGELDWELPLRTMEPGAGFGITDVVALSDGGFLAAGGTGAGLFWDGELGLATDTGGGFLLAVDPSGEPTFMGIGEDGEPGVTVPLSVDVDTRGRVIVGTAVDFSEPEGTGVQPPMELVFRRCRR